ncbi:H-NS family nucleoid-associated regulatory protein [Cereibacter johrii]|uniref:Nucleoid protein H-NS n=1 Tax=Cereibacter johrii TaxID=445629 RepID=A0ABX5J3H1_9RHOB|nr:H-NS histone family protein [Cereibacter johrii]PTM75590.1 nucleoid protein H-NS [Cereibacter johrii]
MERVGPLQMDCDAVDLDALSREELEELQAEVTAAIAAIENRRKQEAVAELAKLAGELGFSLGDLTGVSEAHWRAPLPFCYANPANPTEVWRGRGRKPRWFAQAMAAGWTPEELLV